ncbi:hypothetical protein ZIOFF_010981 [Zingiber officinale]|uniref:Uncharacterized protein n=1 Tax=Zingiber officinale TaxID=94328 RepID=A0A8J5LKC8_ZINOF|nr:hypothetical protein ZIOFF_010981 [Zingiber officinale]
MQSKYRNSGDGYRPRSPFRRNQRRGGFSRSYSKPHNPPATKVEILMEAGRLAAEYLVYKGVLPSSALPPREPSAGGTIQEFRGYGRDNPAPSFFNEPRVPAMARLGYPESGAGYSKKRFNDDYERFGPRKNARVQRTGAYARGFGGPDWDRERGRNGLWMERSRNQSDVMEEDDDDFAPGYSRDRRSGHEEVGSSRVAGDEQHSKSEVVGESGSEIDDAGSKASSNSTRKDAPSAGSADVNKGADDVMVSNTEAGEGKSSEREQLGKKNTVEEDLAMKPVEVDEGVSVSDHADGLLKLGGFPKVPKRPRSSLAHKNPTDLGFKSEAGNRVESASREENEIIVDELPTDASLKQSPTPLSHTSLIHCEHGNEFEVSIGGTETSASKLPTEGSQKDSHIVYTDKSDSEIPVNSAEVDIQSSKQSLESQCELQQNLPSEMSITKVDEDKDDKVSEHSGNRELEKQICSSSPSTFQKNEPSQLYNATKTHVELFIEKPPQDKKMTGPGDQLNPITAPLAPEVSAGSFLKLQRLKHNQSMPFKICDLNLMESPEVIDIPERQITHTSTPPLESGRQRSVDFGLSVNNRAKSSYGFNQLSGDEKVIPVIDLEDNSTIEVNDPSKSKNEIVYPTENVLNQTAHSDNLPAIQDTFLAISDYLGADITCSPSGQAELNNLQVGIGLHGTEGFAVVDDSIYGSLGDIDQLLNLQRLMQWSRSWPQLWLAVVAAAAEAEKDRLWEEEHAAMTSLMAAAVAAWGCKCGERDKHRSPASSQPFWQWRYRVEDAVAADYSL